MCLERMKKGIKISVSVAEIQVRCLLSTRLECYYYTNVLGSLINQNWVFSVGLLFVDDEGMKVNAR
jgi:hypothetical protein